MPTTLRDVARHAGVSTRTVSNVVRGVPQVSQQMRIKVQASLEALNYSPNLLARSLRGGPTGVVMLLVPNLNDPQCGALAHEIVQQANFLGYSVMLGETQDVQEQAHAAIKAAAKSGLVDGLLVTTSRIENFPTAYLDTSVPTVLLGSHAAGARVDTVGIDDAVAAYDAVTHLVQRGRNRVAAIATASMPEASANRRLLGYKRAMASAGFLQSERIVTVSVDSDTINAEVMRQLFAAPEPPNGLFCLNDLLAASTLRELYKQGIRVPNDVEVVGFGDAPMSRHLTPSMTSIRPDHRQIASMSLSLLAERISGDQSGPRDVRTAHELVARDSSPPLGRA